MYAPCLLIYFGTSIVPADAISSVVLGEGEKTNDCEFFEVKESYFIFKKDYMT